MKTIYTTSNDAAKIANEIIEGAESLGTPTVDMKKVYLVSVSGGKDSQAALIYMMKNYTGKNIVAYTCDTGWEHEKTYEHIEYLSQTLTKIEVVRSEKYSGFEDMCIKRKGFPTRLGRFCTEELKITPSNNYILKWKNAGYRVINITGVRAEESSKRSGEGVWKTTFMGLMPKFRKYKGEFRAPSKNSLKKFYSKHNTVIMYQPIVYWSANQVLDYNEDQGTINNPLYLQGFNRVGCIPCIMARVDEIGRLGPQHVTRVKELEDAVAKVSSKPKNNKPKFFQDKAKDGDLKGIFYYFNKHNKNALRLDL